MQFMRKKWTNCASSKKKCKKWSEPSDIKMFAICSILTRERLHANMASVRLNRDWDAVVAPRQPPSAKVRLTQGMPFFSQEIAKVARPQIRCKCDVTWWFGIEEYLRHINKWITRSDDVAYLYKIHLYWIFPSSNCKTLNPMERTVHIQGGSVITER